MSTDRAPRKRAIPAMKQVENGKQAAKMYELAAFISAHADSPLTLSSLAKKAGLSPSHLQRVFKAVIGVSPKEYGDAERLKTFKSRLREGQNVTQATFDAGYGSTSRIHERIDGGLGMTPRAYRAGGAGEIIVYAVRTTKLGELMMAATERGVCFVAFGESSAALEAQLKAEYPKAVLRSAEAAAQSALDDWMAALDENLSNGKALPDLPLDLRGTAFQIRVWRFLLSVKSGDVVSYSEIAAGVDAPRAVRAAANACGANRLAVLVPCHRALRANGELGGYRWGLERKRALLDSERSDRGSRHAGPQASGHS
jgi:AraC family transcriptional regulator of adaptative response/methylated-DNA-[protein]-cysteine methyltransferase